jgi:hypothetical protein
MSTILSFLTYECAVPRREPPQDCGDIFAFKDDNNKAKDNISIMNFCGNRYPSKDIFSQITSNLKTVSRLYLNSFSESESFFFHLFEKVKHGTTTLQVLHVAENNLNDQHAREIASMIRTNRSLTELNISHNNFSHMDASLARSFRHAFKDNHVLKKLDISKSLNFFDDVIRFMPHVQNLIINDAKHHVIVPHENITHFSAQRCYNTTLKLPEKLEYLDLRYARSFEVTSLHIFASLKEIDVRNCSLNSSLAFWARILKTNRTLQTLYFTTTKTTQHQKRFFKVLHFHNQTLKYLIIENNGAPFSVKAKYYPMFLKNFDIYYDALPKKYHEQMKKMDKFICFLLPLRSQRKI